jgi:hypothetical protein
MRPAFIILVWNRARRPHFSEVSFFVVKRKIFFSETAQKKDRFFIGVTAPLP